MKYVVGNWKANKTQEEVKEWLEEWGKTTPPEGVEVVVAAPSPFLSQINAAIETRQVGGIKVAAQDVSPFPFGAYTGAVSMGMIKEWVEYVIVGHSERREYFHETNQEVANKVGMVVEAGKTPIVCVDEPYARAQVAAIEKEWVDKMILAYEPLEAIGTGTPQEPGVVKEVVDQIRKIVEVPVLYGGSVKPENAAEYVGLEGVAGLLVGGASLEASKFRAIMETV